MDLIYEMKALGACLTFGLICLGFLLLTTWAVIEVAHAFMAIFGGL